MTRTPVPGYPANPPRLKAQPDWPLGPVDFDSATPPPGYLCMVCGAHGVRLWREYQCVASELTLHCFDCAVDRAGGPKKEHALPHESDEYTPDDTSISWLVPAVPVAEGDTFWGFGSVPSDAIAWWWGLMPRPRDLGWTEEHRLGILLEKWKRMWRDVDYLWKSDRRLLDAWVARGNELEKRLRVAGHVVEDWRPYDHIRRG